VSDRDATDAYRSILAANARYAQTFDGASLAAAPSAGMAIIACMDARLDVAAALGLRPGGAHVIRNAGGIATDDAIRSVVLSQELLGTDTILVIGHTQCGLLGADEAALRAGLAARSGARINIGFGAFEDLEASVRASVERLRTHPWIRRVPVRGLIFDVATGRLTEVG
jgi:carbonic anhydrase